MRWDVLPRQIGTLLEPPADPRRRGSTRKRGGATDQVRLRERRKPRKCEAFGPSALLLPPPPSANSGAVIQTGNIRIMSQTSNQYAPPRGESTSLATSSGKYQDD